MSAEQRLLCNDILERIQRIESSIRHGREAFDDSHVLRDAIILSFIVIGEAVKKLEPSLTQQHPDIPWQSIAGFRDILVHHYRRTRLELVWRTAQEDLPALKTAVTAMLKQMDESESQP